MKIKKELIAKTVIIITLSVLVGLLSLGLIEMIRTDLDRVLIALGVITWGAILVWASMYLSNKAKSKKNEN